MIPLSILLLVGAGIAFFWAVDHDQFDDMETPRLLPLLDNAGPPRASDPDDPDPVSAEPVSAEPDSREPTP